MKGKQATNFYILGKRCLLFIAVMLVVFLSMFPIAWIIMASLKSSVDVFAYPPRFLFVPTLEHYFNVVSQMVRPFVNSIIVTIVSTFLAMALGCMAGYSLARLRPKYGTFLILFILGVRMLPPIVLVVPMFQIMSTLGLMDTLLALIIPYTALSVPLTTWMMHSFFKDLPRQLEEAAIVDGCTPFGAFWRIILPLSTPGLAASAIFSFTLAWNDLEFALPLTTFDAVTLPVVASRVRVEEGILWGQLGAVASVMTIPVIIFTFLVQKHIVKALTAGSVKG